jgi:hypothetical protein
VMCVGRQNFVIGREEDRAHQDEGDNQFGNKRDGIAVDARHGDSIPDRVVRWRAMEQQGGKCHTADRARELRGAVKDRVPTPSLSLASKT